VSEVLKGYLRLVLGGMTLSEEQAGSAMGQIMDGAATPAQIGALLAALAVRGETEDEIVGFARVMRARAVPLRSQGAVDTCGTGGDGAPTFNISTVASLVVAACGVPVVKHGNRSASGRAGSADLLEALGVRIDAPVERVQSCLDETGWTFLFAPSFHASTRHAALPRRELGGRTVFNLLGPLTNPGYPAAQLVGVPRPELTGLLARCLRRLGVARAWVVHGSGCDELTLSGETLVHAVENDSVRSFVVTPADAGLPVCDATQIASASLQESVAIAREVLAGGRGSRRDVVLLNAAATLALAGRAADLREGAALAAEALDRGGARRVLETATGALAA
jgi:anthranilate phosphoribosyltransferase